MALNAFSLCVWICLFNCALGDTEELEFDVMGIGALLEPENVIHTLPEDIPENVAEKELIEGSWGDILTMPPYWGSLDFLSVVGVDRRWPNNTIPYSLANLDLNELRILEMAMQQIQNNSCIRFIPCKICKDRVYIQKDNQGCYSTHLGRNGDRQVINLGVGCWKIGNVLHELLHVVGFYHEQTRLDRDDYITVDMNNIKQEWKPQFEKYTTDLSSVGRFDFASVMMYPASDSRISVTPRKPYLIPKDSFNDQIGRMGQRDGLSPEDIRKINIAYCGLSTTATPRPTTTSSTPTSSKKKCNHTFNCPVKHKCDDSVTPHMCVVREQGEGGEIVHLPGIPCTKTRSCPANYHCHHDEFTCYSNDIEVERHSHEHN